MKSSMMILFVILFSYPVMAQDETLISGEIESGWYVAPLFKVGQINGDTGFFIGGQGGWIINHRFVIGGMGYGLINDIDIKDAKN